MPRMLRAAVFFAAAAEAAAATLTLTVPTASETVSLTLPTSTETTTRSATLSASETDTRWGSFAYEAEILRSATGPLQVGQHFHVRLRLAADLDVRLHVDDYLNTTTGEAGLKLGRPDVDCNDTSNVLAVAGLWQVSTALLRTLANRSEEYDTRRAATYRSPPPYERRAPNPGDAAWLLTANEPAREVTGAAELAVEAFGSFVAPPESFRICFRPCGRCPWAAGNGSAVHNVTAPLVWWSVPAEYTPFHPRSSAFYAGSFSKVRYFLSEPAASPALSDHPRASDVLKIVPFGKPCVLPGVDGGPGVADFLESPQGVSMQSGSFAERPSAAYSTQLNESFAYLRIPGTAGWHTVCADLVEERTNDGTTVVRNWRVLFPFPHPLGRNASEVPGAAEYGTMSGGGEGGGGGEGEGVLLPFPDPYSAALAVQASPYAVVGGAPALPRGAFFKAAVAAVRPANPDLLSTAAASSGGVRMRISGDCFAPLDAPFSEDEDTGSPLSPEVDSPQIVAAARLRTPLVHGVFHLCFLRSASDPWIVTATITVADVLSTNVTFSTPHGALAGMWGELAISDETRFVGPALTGSVKLVAPGASCWGKGAEGVAEGGGWRNYTGFAAWVAFPRQSPSGYEVCCGVELGFGWSPVGWVLARAAAAPFSPRLAVAAGPVFTVAPPASPEAGSWLVLRVSADTPVLRPAAGLDSFKIVANESFCHGTAYHHQATPFASLDPDQHGSAPETVVYAPFEVPFAREGGWKLCYGVEGRLWVVLGGLFPRERVPLRYELSTPAQASLARGGVVHSVAVVASGNVLNTLPSQDSFKLTLGRCHNTAIPGTSTDDLIGTPEGTRVYLATHTFELPIDFESPVSYSVCYRKASSVAWIPLSPFLTVYPTPVWYTLRNPAVADGLLTVDLRSHGLFDARAWADAAFLVRATELCTKDAMQSAAPSYLLVDDLGETDLAGLGNGTAGFMLRGVAARGEWRVCWFDRGADTVVGLKGSAIVVGEALLSSSSISGGYKASDGASLLAGVETRTDVAGYAIIVRGTDLSWSDSIVFIPLRGALPYTCSGADFLTGSRVVLNAPGVVFIKTTTPITPGSFTTCYWHSATSTWALVPGELCTFSVVESSVFFTVDLSAITVNDVYTDSAGNPQGALTTSDVAMFVPTFRGFCGDQVLDDYSLAAASSGPSTARYLFKAALTPFEYKLCLKKGAKGARSAGAGLWAVVREEETWGYSWRGLLLPAEVGLELVLKGEERGGGVEKGEVFDVVVRTVVKQDGSVVRAAFDDVHIRALNGLLLVVSKTGSKQYMGELHARVALFTSCDTGCSVIATSAAGVSNVLNIPVAPTASGSLTSLPRTPPTPHISSNLHPMYLGFWYPLTLIDANPLTNHTNSYLSGFLHSITMTPKTIKAQCQMPDGAVSSFPCSPPFTQGTATFRIRLLEDAPSVATVVVGGGAASLKFFFDPPPVESLVVTDFFDASLAAGAPAAPDAPATRYWLAARPLPAAAVEGTPGSFLLVGVPYLVAVAFGGGAEYGHPSKMGIRCSSREVKVECSEGAVVRGRGNVTLRVASACAEPCAIEVAVSTVSAVLHVRSRFATGLQLRVDIRKREGTEWTTVGAGGVVHVMEPLSVSARVVDLWGALAPHADEVLVTYTSAGGAASHAAVPPRLPLSGGRANATVLLPHPCAFPCTVTLVALRAAAAVSVAHLSVAPDPARLRLAAREARAPATPFSDAVVVDVGVGQSFSVDLRLQHAVSSVATVHDDTSWVTLDPDEGIAFGEETAGDSVHRQLSASACRFDLTLSRVSGGCQPSPAAPCVFALRFSAVLWDAAAGAGFSRFASNRSQTGTAAAPGPRGQFFPEGNGGRPAGVEIRRATVTLRVFPYGVAKGLAVVEVSGLATPVDAGQQWYRMAAGTTGSVTVLALDGGNRALATKQPVSIEVRSGQATLQGVDVGFTTAPEDTEDRTLTLGFTEYKFAFAAACLLCRLTVRTGTANVSLFFTVSQPAAAVSSTTASAVTQTAGSWSHLVSLVQVTERGVEVFDQDGSFTVRVALAGGGGEPSFRVLCEGVAEACVEQAAGVFTLRHPRVSVEQRLGAGGVTGAFAEGAALSPPHAAGFRVKADEPAELLVTASAVGLRPYTLRIAFAAAPPMRLLSVGRGGKRPAATDLPVLVFPGHAAAAPLPRGFDVAAAARRGELAAGVAFPILVEAVDQTGNPVVTNNQRASIAAGSTLGAGGGDGLRLEPNAREEGLAAGQRVYSAVFPAACSECYLLATYHGADAIPWESRYTRIGPLDVRAAANASAVVVSGWDAYGTDWPLGEARSFTLSAAHVMGETVVGLVGGYDAASVEVVPAMYSEKSGFVDEEARGAISWEKGEAAGVVRIVPTAPCAACRLVFGVGPSARHPGVAESRVALRAAGGGDTFRFVTKAFRLLAALVAPCEARLPCVVRVTAVDREGRVDVHFDEPLGVSGAASRGAFAAAVGNWTRGVGYAALTWGRSCGACAVTLRASSAQAATLAVSVRAVGTRLLPMGYLTGERTPPDTRVFVPLNQTALLSFVLADDWGDPDFDAASHRSPAVRHATHASFDALVYGSGAVELQNATRDPARQALVAALYPQDSGRPFVLTFTVRAAALGALAVLTASAEFSADARVPAAWTAASSPGIQITVVPAAPALQAGIGLASDAAVSEGAAEGGSGSGGFALSHPAAHRFALRAWVYVEASGGGLLPGGASDLPVRTVRSVVPGEAAVYQYSLWEVRATGEHALQQTVAAGEAAGGAAAFTLGYNAEACNSSAPCTATFAVTVRAYPNVTAAPVPAARFFTVVWTREPAVNITVPTLPSPLYLDHPYPVRVFAHDPYGYLDPSPGNSMDLLVTSGVAYYNATTGELVEELQQNASLVELRNGVAEFVVVFREAAAAAAAEQFFWAVSSAAGPQRRQAGAVLRLAAVRVDVPSRGGYGAGAAAGLHGCPVLYLDEPVTVTATALGGDGGPSRGSGRLCFDVHAAAFPFALSDTNCFPVADGIAVYPDLQVTRLRLFNATAPDAVWRLNVRVPGVPEAAVQVYFTAVARAAALSLRPAAAALPPAWVVGAPLTVVVGAHDALGHLASGLWRAADAALEARFEPRPPAGAAAAPPPPAVSVGFAQFAHGLAVFRNATAAGGPGTLSFAVLPSPDFPWRTLLGRVLVQQPTTLLVDPDERPPPSVAVGEHFTVSVVLLDDVGEVAIGDSSSLAQADCVGTPDRRLAAFAGGAATRQFSRGRAAFTLAALLPGAVAVHVTAALAGAGGALRASVTVFIGGDDAAPADPQAPEADSHGDLASLPIRVVISAWTTPAEFSEGEFKRGVSAACGLPAGNVRVDEVCALGAEGCVGGSAAQTRAGGTLEEEEEGSAALPGGLAVLFVVLVGSENTYGTGQSRRDVLGAAEARLRGALAAAVASCRLGNCEGPLAVLLPESFAVVAPDATPTATLVAPFYPPEVTTTATATVHFYEVSDIDASSTAGFHVALCTLVLLPVLLAS
ncbi:hypothetical protein DIPPA_16776 [Diplonema papillatum]|nr:hypothetical protein DIPPA_16776 [Diplonema papillatum]